MSIEHSLGKKPIKIEDISLEPEEIMFIHEQSSVLAKELLSKVKFEFDVFTNLAHKSVEDLESSLALVIDSFLDNYSENDVKEFIIKFASDEKIKEAVAKNPEMVLHIDEPFYRQEALSDPDALDKYLINIDNYAQELAAVDKRLKDRMNQSQIATVEELLLGTYYDVLEYQVRDAVKIFRNKGYNTFESGYDANKLKGEQMIGFDISGKALPEVPAPLKESLSKKQIAIRMRDAKDRYQLVLTPLVDIPTVAEWEPIWKEVAESMPAFDNKPAPRNIYTLNARDFYDEQMDMKKDGQ